MSDLLERKRLVPVLCVDGPCAGIWASVAVFGQELWQRVGRPGSTSVETQMWARYDHHPLLRARYIYSGITVTTDELQRGIAAHKAAGHTYGESEGA